MWAACYKYVRGSFFVSGIRIVVVRDLAKVEARVRFPYPAPDGSKSPLIFPENPLPSKTSDVINSSFATDHRLTGRDGAPEWCIDTQLIDRLS
jgi:hypothetical protein